VHMVIDAAVDSSIEALFARALGTDSGRAA